jgi:APA family basic amino acid/polyamine antiporter
MCVALVVGNSIGSGVFLLPASLAPFGLNSVLAWAFTACGAIFLAIVFARLSRAYPAAGGPYAYVHLAFGPLPAFIVAWGYWISIWVGNAAIATGAVSYLSPLLPWIVSVPGASAAVTLFFLWLLTFVNWYGIRASGWVQAVTTVLKVLPLLVVAVLGLFSVRSGNVAAAAGVPLSVGGTTAAATLTLWALLGLESATIPADKVRDPSRVIPLATLLGTVITALICIVACTTVLLLVPPQILAQSNAPFVDLARQYWGSTAGKLLAVFAAISGFGALNGWILLQGELPNAMAKSGVFPSIFARESPRRTPTFALLFSSGLVTLLILMN